MKWDGNDKWTNRIMLVIGVIVIGLMLFTGGLECRVFHLRF